MVRQCVTSVFTFVLSPVKSLENFLHPMDVRSEIVICSGRRRLANKIRKSRNNVLEPWVFMCHKDRLR